MSATDDWEPPRRRRGACSPVRSRSTIRFRLTLLYSSLFLLCGALLLAVCYFLVQRSLEGEEGTSSERVIENYGYTQKGLDYFYKLPVPPPAPEKGRTANNVGDVIKGVQGDIKSDALHSLLVGSSIALGVMAILAGIVGWVAAGRALRPVGRLTARAQRLSEDNLNERLDLEGPRDELKELADTLDGMLGRLEVAFNAERHFAANVSHEVRTPLSIMRGEAELALVDPDSSLRERRLAYAVREQVERTESLLDSLLALSRSESTMNESSPVDLAELAGDVVSQRVEAADRARVHLDLELGRAVVDGDPWLLERLVANLVDNGINHNVEGGWLRVSVGSENGHSLVEVSNSGDHLDAQQVKSILEPFRRVVEDKRPGYGLGMTIVRSVVKAHGGSVDVVAREQGGLDVLVELPGRKLPSQKLVGAS